MVKLLYIVYTLATIAGVQACSWTCWLVGTATDRHGGTCTYSCFGACPGMRENQDRDEFLSSLHSHGHSCSVLEGSIVCRRTAKFGGCYDHYWMCGSDCESHHKALYLKLACTSSCNQSCASLGKTLVGEKPKATGTLLRRRRLPRSAVSRQALYHLDLAVCVCCLEAVRQVIGPGGGPGSSRSYKNKGGSLVSAQLQRSVGAAKSRRSSRGREARSVEQPELQKGIGRAQKPERSRHEAQSVNAAGPRWWLGRPKLQRVVDAAGPRKITSIRLAKVGRAEGQQDPGPRKAPNLARAWNRLVCLVPGQYLLAVAAAHKKVNSPDPFGLWPAKTLLGPSCKAAGGSLQK
ncbi:hypothetical protein B0J13DRAFT_656418 [Dactylonectria estremocensis]|uniref:Uncharacterized protein n=1 Tax=Dactylonectria estremocensis TaxID=1079267 RepID=A0A9P9IBY6_9HYPO|nr:hypothetical protein B0J13DRAFT_656418 [Dactylonectria estremocensis]